MKKILVIQHEECTPPGSLEKWFKKNDLNPDYYFFSKNSGLNIGRYDSFVILGGGMNVDQEIEFPWLKEEKKEILKMIKSNKPILGICLGAQLLAEALGGSVFRATDWELGWFDTELVLEKKVIKAFHWHAYQFTLPPESTLIAKSRACPVQGFKLKKILAYQFHPEANKDWLDLNIDSPNIPNKCDFIQNKTELLEGLKFQSELEDWFFEILDKHLE